ncbi:hypothetical protein FHS19_006020 [Paenibacillus rhizosphaerae]|uniref:RES domain-containing protein n=1 Tax=Paenibacillus rhizosphaerae TaxID=297318 RepID=A0A839U0L3_9BACL|nr:hypothetical protein [Paenibacillus rhizosphaerae]MBB3131300.1 hypothetical protein [Paenibacillus rhizosphaerae]
MGIGILDEYKIMHDDILEYLDFLSHKTVDLPIIQQKDEDFFPELIHKLLNQYQEMLVKLPRFSDSHKLKTRTLSEYIEKSLDAYYSGQPAKAYDFLESGLNVVKDKILQAKSFRDMVPNTLYRMRVGLNKSYKRSEMFHIPFDKRGLATTQRYSIPGLPCLYLGGSIYVCWEELKRPDLYAVHGSKYQFSEKYKGKVNILYFGITPKMFAHEISQEYKYRAYVRKKNKSALNDKDVEDLKILLETYIILWPIICSCSIKVKNTNDSFKPEYIVPQLLLQWVSNHSEFQGICYFSVNTFHNKENYLLNQNIVIPVKSSKKEGYCSSLISMFQLTESAPWQIFNLNSIPLVEKKIESSGKLILEKKDILPRGEMIIGISPMDSIYSKTQFGMYEEFLDSYELASVNDVD